MIIDVCPVCGEDCIRISFTSIPPKRRVQCSKCGWHMDEPETVERIPYVYDKDLSSIPPSCRYCSNHPSNGGTGICNCILGQQTTC